MRIQHNIMAMGAYRNYTNNVNAMKKNLEKLSSGYKINRAGDDAAGLAISEKMRAQITGLETAQKNAKDGISLVQTAEGALTEVHDMLNRMVTLATQSANGTYDNTTDRKQLQKELDQLRTEIDRIADSSNFNGIKLLDGSMSSKIANAEVKQFDDLPGVGTLLGTDTVLHQDLDEANATTYFGMELHNLSYTGEADHTFKIEISNDEGSVTLEGKMKAAGTVKGEDIVAALTTAGGTDKLEFSVVDENGNSSTFDPTNLTINGDSFSVKEGANTHTVNGQEKTGVRFELNGTTSTADISFRVNISAGAGAGQTTELATIDAVTATKDVVASTGKMIGNGKNNATAKVAEFSTAGRIDKGVVKFAKADATDKATATPAADVAILGGTLRATDPAAAPDKISISGANADYEFTFDLDNIQDAIDEKVAAGTAVTAGSVTVVLNASNKFELQANGVKIAEATAVAAADGSTVNLEFTAAAGGNVSVGTAKITQHSGATWAVGDVATDIVTESGTAKTLNTGLQTSVINFGTAAAGGSTLDGTKITAAALEAGATAGDITLNYNTTGNTVELLVNGTVVGSADPDTANDSGTLTFKDANGNNLGTVAVTGNGEIDASRIQNLETGLTFGNAELGYSLDPVDHDALQAALKVAGVTQDDLGVDANLDLKYDGANNEFVLEVNGKELGRGGVTGGALDIKDSVSNPGTPGASLLKITFDDNTLANADISKVSDYTDFANIGITVSLSENNKQADTTALDGDAVTAAVAKAVQNGADAPADGAELTVVYNAGAATGEKFELKLGDMVVGTADETTALVGDKLTLSFTVTDDAGNTTNLGSVSISGLKADFAAKDFAATPINTAFKYKEGVTPAITADMTGLNTDKIAEDAQALGTIAAGKELEVVFDPTAGTNGQWSLQIDGSTIGNSVEASADSTTIDFGDYGKVELSKAFVKNDLTPLGVDTTAPIKLGTGQTYQIETVTSELKGDYLVTASDQSKNGLSGTDRLASTVINLKKEMVADGASIFVAGKKYVFSTGDDTIMPDDLKKEDVVKVDISDLDAESDSYISDVAKRLTKEYNDNNTGVYTLGWDGDRITVTETKSHGNLKDNGTNIPDNYAKDGWDLTTMEGIQKSLGYSAAGTQGKKLTLQIGDTAEKFNQLEVDVSDCHSSAIGVGDIDISTQQGAADAVDKIKAAINYISDVRGTLGATQNRLDHTINNLSVMTENIQDAESTIRDTDVAAEMMEYTKNNILIQSAQAMLAQANQVPQGVLQLLQ